MNRSRIRVVDHNADTLHEALGLTGRKLAIILNKIVSSIKNGAPISEIVERIWNDEDFTNEEVAVALIYLGMIIGDVEHAENQNQTYII